MPFSMRQAPLYKCALVTGGKSGLGKELSSLLEAKGIRVIATSSSDFDLQNPDQRRALCDLISSEKPDLIVNNAGLGFYGPATSHPIENQRAVIEVNALALTEITIHAAKTLKNCEMKGTILNIGSATALVRFPTFATYAASKRFVASISESLDSELKSEGIRVLCALPGQISTDFRMRASKGIPQKPSHLPITPEVAAKHLWKQIKKGKQLYIFDWRTRFMIWCSSICPKSMTSRLLRSSISNRY